MILIICIFLAEISLQLAQEGCQGLSQPPAWYYENTLINKSISEIPKWALTQMKESYESVIRMMNDDYLGETTPYGSYVFYGASGRALLNLLVLENNKTYHLQMALSFIEEALSSLPSQPDHYGYLKGNVGIFAVASMVYFTNGEIDKSHYYLSLVQDTFANVTSDDCADYDEGIAGLIDLAPILNNFFGSEVIKSEDEMRVGHVIFENGLKYYNKTTKALQFKNWLGESTVWWIGVGVGSAGPIYQFLKRKDLMANKTIRSYVRNTMEYFLTQQNPKTGEVRSDYPDRVQWCHGSPGFIPLFIEAHKVFQDDRFLYAAKLATEYTFYNGILMKGMQLGHGVSGNIYMCLEMYKYTKEKYFLSGALSMLLVSLKTPQLTDPKEWKSWDCVPGSLWVSSQGGIVSLFYDLVMNYKNLDKVSMPVFGSM